MRTTAFPSSMASMMRASLPGRWLSPRAYLSGQEGAGSRIISNKNQSIKNVSCSQGGVNDTPCLGEMKRWKFFDEVNVASPKSSWGKSSHMVAASGWQTKALGKHAKLMQTCQFFIPRFFKEMLCDGCLRCLRKNYSVAFNYWGWGLDLGIGLG